MTKNPHPAYRIASLIGSRRLSVVLMSLVALGYLVWVVPFQFYGVPLARIQNIATGWAFQLLGLALAVNTVVCIALRVPRTWRRAVRFNLPDAARVPSTMGVAVASPGPPAEVRSRLSRAFRIRGFRVRTSNDGTVLAAAKGRLSALATISLHVAILMLAGVPFLVTDSFRGKATLVEGEDFDGSQAAYWAEPSQQELVAMGDDLPRVTLRLDLVETEFWRDVQLFTKLVAWISYGEGQRAALAINKPVTIDGSQVAVDGFGYAPEFRFVPAQIVDGAEPDAGFVKLKVFPPGAVDDFDLAGTVYRIRVSIFPDAEIVGKEVVNRSLNLTDPAIAVLVEDVTLEGEQGQVYAGIVRPGERIELPEGDLSFPSVRHYAEIRVVRNPAASLFLGALAVAFVSSSVRFVGRRREVLVRIDEVPDGSMLSVGVRAEYWRSSFEESVNRLVAHHVSALPETGDGGETRHAR